ncbi:MAG TPA: 3-hydroxybutyrate dehydrogenase [Bryobacteraceae bacterium]|jgi:3-hydroxybutyrate dehydrogenase|nr:3-hydroxybutyrate dehydrogenase [Bryobacteraceae bacterium]
MTRSRLAGKVAVVTGAASGIGQAIAKSFAAEGARVAIADLNQPEAEATAIEIGRLTGSPAIAVRTDVTDEESVDAAVEHIIRELGGVDILVSNAGVQWISPIEQLQLADWKRILAVHLDGAFLTSRACLRHMYASGRGGSIIYMGSVHSKVASILKAPYVTAKHGILGLCRTVAKEGASHGVRANVLCPGFVRTPLVDRQIPEQAELLGISEQDVIQKVMLKDTVDGNFTTIAEVAEAAIFIAAQETLALTGQSLTISHGWTME